MLDNESRMQHLVGVLTRGPHKVEALIRRSIAHLTGVEDGAGHVIHVTPQRVHFPGLGVWKEQDTLELETLMAAEPIPSKSP